MGKQGSNGSTAIVKAADYAIVQHHERAIGVLQTNIGPGGITARDLTEVRVPSASSKQWCIETLKGDEHVDAFYGVPLMFRDSRLYWVKSYEESGGGDPPDCKTIDPEAVVGIGDPGGDCMACEMSQFTEGTPTGRPRCRKYRALFVCGEEDYLPFVLVLPITSIQECVKYFVRLGQRGIRHFEAVLKFSLVGDVNKNGIKFSKLCLELEERLPEDVAEKMALISAEMKKVFGGYSIADAVRQQDEENRP